MIKYRVLLLLFSSFILCACYAKELKPEKIFKIPVREPSGLAFIKSENCFLTVSDEYPVIYKLNMKGEITGEIKVDANDLEGIAVSDDGSIFVVDEAGREVIHLDRTGNEIMRFSVDADTDDDVKSPVNNGPEGICIDSDNLFIYIVNEKNPGKILVYDFTGRKTAEYDPDFADDYSGICYDSKNKNFLVLSDEDKSVSRWDPDKGILETHHIAVVNPEGIVVVNNGNFYIVSDRKSRLYKFKKIIKIK